MLEGMEGQILEMVLLAMVLCAILIGSNKGLIRSLYDVVKNLLILVATVGMAPVFARKFSEATVAREGVGYVIAFFVSVILFNLLGKFLGIVNEIPIAKTLNRLGGAVFGAVTGIFLVWAALALLGAFQEYEWCQRTIEAAKENNIVMWFQSCNPVTAILKRFDFPVF